MANGVPSRSALRLDPSRYRVSTVRPVAPKWMVVDGMVPLLGSAKGPHRAIRQGPFWAGSVE